MVLIVVLPDPAGPLAQEGPAGATAPDAVVRELGNPLAAVAAGWEVPVVLPGPDACRQGVELQATVLGGEAMGFLQMSVG
jgi:hypothetical protein